MPANLTHQYFTKKVMPLLVERFPFVERYPSVLLLATQGPDPFFFYGYLPWYPSANKALAHDFGHHLHQLPGTRALLPLFVCADSELEKTYAIGALLHFVLDHLVHPFVFYQSGFDEHGQLRAPYHSYHNHYEALMDMQLRQHVRHSYKLHVMDAFRLPNDWLRALSRLYQKAFADVAEDTFYDSAIQMRELTRLLYSPLGLKRRMLALFGKKRAAYSLSQTRFIPKRERYDYLNMERRVWRDPVSGAETSASLFDLLAKAEQLLVNQLQLEFGQLSLPDINYDGEPSGQTKTLHQSIYLTHSIL